MGVISHLLRTSTEGTPATEHRTYPLSSDEERISETFLETMKRGMLGNVLEKGRGTDLWVT